MRFDANGNELKQLTVWIPAELHRLIRADGVNVNRFVNEQFEAYYGTLSAYHHPDRDHLAHAARESITRQKEIATERQANREHARAAVQALRAEREAAQARQDGIADALVQVIGDGQKNRYRRMLPENDPNGDRVDDWDALVRRVSRLCGAEIDSAEVAAGLRTLIAAA
ncbi:MAG TPA: hypothetical protein HA263_03950 [Methanoregulaceae archaeon]|nr:hypothetical protein [Methanoregulaceae archaeon]